MKITLRLLCYSVVTFAIPFLIWLIDNDFPMDSVWWITAGFTLFGVYELITYLRRNK